MAPDRSSDMEIEALKAMSLRRVFTILALIFLVLLLPAVATRVLHTTQGVSRNAYLTELVLPAVFLLLAALVVVMCRRAFGRRALGIVWFRWSRAEAAGTLLLIVVVLIAYVAVSFLVHRLGVATRHERIFYADGLGLAFFIGVTIVAVFATPLIEELLFRGVVQAVLAHAIGPVAALSMQAILFAILHLRPVGGLIPLFVFGLMTGLWRWRRQTLLPVILAHLAVNGLLNAARWPDWLDLTRVKVSQDHGAALLELTRPNLYDPNDDAYYDYERAYKASKPIPEELDGIIRESPNEWTSEQRDGVNEWIAANGEALEHLRRGAGKPYYYPHYQIQDPHLAGSSNAAAQRDLAFALNARIRLCASEGRDEDMIRDLALLYRFGRHLGGKKVLVDQLRGAAMRGMALGTTRKVLAHHTFSIHTLELLHENVQSFDDSNDYAMDFEVERLYCLNEIQGIFTDDGQGSGHVPRAVLKTMPGLTPGQEAAFLALERHETTQMVEAFLDQIQTAAHKSPWELHDDPNGASRILRDLMGRNVFLEVIGPPYIRAMEIPWQARTDLSAGLALLAALRYEADWGRLPETLEELVATGYLEQVPSDPYSSGPLVYRRTEGSFLLYSYGLDFDDDGGTPSKWGQGEPGGDQVFWPVVDDR